MGLYRPFDGCPMTSPALGPCQRCGIPVERVTVTRCCGGGQTTAHRVREQLVDDGGGSVHRVDATIPRGQIVYAPHQPLCDAIVAARGEFS